MNGQYAKPGDTVEFTFQSDEYFGKRVTVIDRPAGIDWGDNQGDVWFWWENMKSHQFVTLGNYTIVSRGNPIEGIKDSVDKSLKRQLNDNLRHICGYD